MKTSRKKIFTLKFFIITIGIVILANYILKLAIHENYSSKSISTTLYTVDDTLKQVADIMNKHCPQQIDSITVLDGTIAAYNNTFAYNYTIRVDTNQYHVKDMELVMNEYWQNNYKTNPAAEDFKRMKTTLFYNYKDVKGNFLFRVKISPN
jgi:hypothetical protein